MAIQQTDRNARVAIARGLDQPADTLSPGRSDGGVDALNFTLDRVGLGYRAKAGIVTMDLSHLRESRGELSAELTVTIGDEHISRARFNLASLTARTTHAKYLLGIPIVNECPWLDVLERLCLEALNLHRQGEPVERLVAPDQDIRSRYLLDPVLPLGDPTFLFGPGGNGKSTVAAAIAVSVETGAEVIPGWHPLSAPVLVLDWEDSARVWAKRTKAIAAGVGVDATRIRYQPQVRPLAERAEPLAAYIADNAIELLIVDSMGLASGGGREGGSPEDSTLRFFEALRLIGATTLVVDHVTGDNLQEERPISKPYGSIYKVNLARSVYELRRERQAAADRAELLLLHNKVNDGMRQAPQGLVINYQESGQVLRFDRGEPQAPELVGSLTSKDRMLRMLRDGAATTADIAAELDIKPRSVDSMVSRYSTLFARLPDKRVGLSGMG